MSMKTLRIPSAVITGLGVVKQAGEEAKNLGSKKVLIVSDEILVKLGVLDELKLSLEQNGIQFCLFDRVFTEPTVEYVEEGLTVFKENDCDLVVAIGGGSPIDTAKAISVMVNNEGSIINYKGIGNIPKKGMPLIAIPTTAGTGSEVTMTTIITDSTTNVKMLFISPYLMPKVAIVDPLLTQSMPRNLTAATGVDALTHAIEAYVSVKAQLITDLLSISAIKLITNNLRQAWSNGSNIEAREKVMMGSLLAGMAFSNSSVALVHGMSRPIGAYFHVPHGASNAALLGVVMEFSIIGNPERYAHIAEAMGENTRDLNHMEASELAIKAVKRLIKDIQVPSLKQLELDKDKVWSLAPQMAEDAITSGSPGNNPRLATKEEIVELYKMAYDQ